MTITLRPGTSDDAAAVADIWHAGWHVSHPGHVPDGLRVVRISTLHEAREAITKIGAGTGADLPTCTR